MERLTPLAAAFLDSEDEEPTTSMAIGSLAVFAGPAPAFTDFVRHIEGRLPAVPRYRQTLRTVPLDLAAPAWVDDAAFDVRWHIRHTALPAPGGREQVGQLVSRVMSRRMDRSRPLWEYWFIEGLADGRWALLSKLHHSMADGVSGTDIYHHVLDPTPEPRPPVPDTWTPAPAASPLSFAADAGWDLARTPVTAAAATVRALASPRQLVRQAAEAARGLITMSAALRPVDASSLLGPLDGSLRYAWAQVSLDDIRAVRRGLGGTVNDVALAAVTGGFRQLLLSRSEEPTPHMLRSMVPVSTRQPGAEGVPDNRVSMMFLCLPVDLAEPEGWLRTVQERGRTHRDTGEPQAGAAMSTLAAYEPFLPVSIGMRLGFRFPQRSVSTVTTNVPGPRATLYGLGRELEEILPFVPIANRVRVSVAIFSYRDTVTFGITGDYSSVPDIQVLARGISESMAALVDAAGRPVEVAT